MRMPRLPPVDISPHTRLRARFCPAVICSVATFFQSHSSSSTTSWARPVTVPCPISERAIRITHVSLGFTTTQALISAPAAAAVCASALERPKGRLKPSARPPPAAAAERRMNLRRFMSNLPSSGQVDRRADTLIGAAAADVGHRLVDVLVGGLRVLLQKRRGRHDLSRLAVAALRHVECRPCLLHGMRAGGRKPLDGDDLVGGLQRTDGNGAGAPHFAVDMHRAGAALRDAAAVFGAGEAHLLADHPEQRGVGLRLHVTEPAFDIVLSHRYYPSRITKLATLRPPRRCGNSYRALGLRSAGLSLSISA